MSSKKNKLMTDEKSSTMNVSSDDKDDNSTEPMTSECENYEIPTQPETLYLDDVRDDEIIIAIGSLKNNSSPGFDGISSRDVKNLMNEMIPIMRHLINCMFRTSIYPDIFKKAIVVPINKTGDVSNIRDYRPVSILPTINKIIEKILHSRIYDFIEDHNILFSHQFGFRKKSSTEIAALEMTTRIREILDEKKISSAVFMDLSKAFDTVNRKKLLHVLNKCGLRGKILELLESYLRDRKQVVKVNKALSNSLNIDTGVIQGSTLGSLLFIIFINSICKLKNLNGNLFLFADDIALINSHEKKENAEQKIGSDMKIILNFVDSLGLVMNMDKTKYMIFHTMNTKYVDHEKINVGNSQVIQRVYTYKYLGLHLDPMLKWNIHVEHVEKKLCFASGVLWKLKKIIPISIKKKIYFSLFQSHLSYMIQVYGSACYTVIKSLQSIQNRTLRNVFGLVKPNNQDDDDYKIQMYTHLVENCLPIRALHYINTACYIYGNIHKSIHTNINIEARKARGRSTREFQPMIARTKVKPLTSFKWALKCQIRNEAFISGCFSNAYFTKLNT